MDRREAPPTVEGWYALHDMRRIDWGAWAEAPQRARDRAIEEGREYLRSAIDVEDADQGASVAYSMLGHKGDLMIVHLRPTPADIDALERRFEQTALAAFTERATSYVSVTEASGYSEKGRQFIEGELDDDSGLANYMRSRLYPTIPDAEHVCFYPMDKRRDPEYNWYDLPFDERADHMDVHGEIGREYAGKVTQMITGSIGLDDWEWGVTLWSNDLTQVKQLLYEMRFDPSSSKFAEFGPFYVGNRFEPADLPAFLSGERLGERDGDVGDRPATPEDASTSAGHADGAHTEHAQSDHASQGHGTDAGAAHDQDDGRAHAHTGDEAAGESPPAHGQGDTADEWVDPEELDDDHSDGREAGIARAPDGDDGADGQAGDDAGGSHAHGDEGGHAHGSGGGHAHDDGDSHGHGDAAAAHGDSDASHAHGSEGDHGHGDASHAHGSGGSSDSADGDGDDHPAAGGGRPPTTDSWPESLAESDDLTQRLAAVGVSGGQEYTGDGYAMLFETDRDARALADEIEGLVDNFDHYDTHELTAVRANHGKTLLASVWDNEDAAQTASGFLTDVEGVGTGSRGPVSGGEAATGGGQATPAAGDATPAGTDDDEGVRAALAEEDIYAGQPHGEDVYALVVYSEADPEELFGEVSDLRESFDHYDSHEWTSVYEAEDGGVAAVVSLWSTAEAAEKASGFLTGLPGVVRKAGEGDGFGTMGMFYTVTQDHREEFVDTFETVGETLAGMDGHRETALLVNHEDANDMFIASRWDAREDAMAFFRSADFRDTVEWGREVLADTPRHVFLA